MFIISYSDIVSLLNDFNIHLIGLSGYEEAVILVLFNILAWFIFFFIIYVVYRFICRLESR